MPKSPLPKALKNASPLYEGRRFDVYGTDSRAFVVHPGAVIILPILSETEILLIRNERFVVDECLWELPAGTREPGENPIDTAFRELREETGYQAKVIEPLLNFYTTPGFCNEKMHAFVAKDLEYVGQQLDTTEKIEPEIVSWKQAKEMIKDGTIHDGKTLVTLLFYLQKENKH